MAEYLTAEDIAAILRSEGDPQISERTVHYYAELKLLPPPEYAGARPRYTAAHLDAMRDLRRQKRQGIRLREMTSSPASRSRAGTPNSAAAPVSPARGAVTVRIARGLTLQADGWSDADLTRIVRAVQEIIDEIDAGGIRR